MPLYFRSRRPLSRRGQYAVAFGALAVVLMGLISWLMVRYYRSRPTEEPQTDSSTAPSVTYTAEDDGTMLLMFTDADAEQFWLIHAAPSDTALYVSPLPAATLSERGQTLAEILRKNGPAKVTQVVASVTGVPVTRYMALTTDKAESFLADLGDGLPYYLPEAVSSTDKDGVTVQLEVGEQVLSAGQAAALWRYKGWAGTTAVQVGADMLVALLNRYLLPERSLRGDFAALSNLTQTNLRIDDYNAYREPLLHLANANVRAPVCQRVDIPGETDNQGRFLPDTAAILRSPPW